MSAIAIITARAGSKRIPKKNIKEFCGKPIIAYSIEAALKSGVFDEVMVSTDSEEIAEIARRYGASVPFLRSEASSNDYATTIDVINEVICKYEKRGQYFDLLCCIYPTAPFVTEKKLQRAVRILRKSKADSLMPVVAFSFPPQRGNVIRNGKLEYQYPEYISMRSQDLEEIYHDCGQFYLCKTQVFKHTGKIVTENTVPLILPDEEVQDIDNLSDWVLAEAKYKTCVLKGDNDVSNI